jgi:enolase
MKIKKIFAREILDSRGNPTIEVEILTDFGISRAIASSGASSGTHEAIEIRDGEKRFMGKGVLKVVNNVNKTIAPRLIGMECTDQENIDKLMIELDGTENKSNLGGNAIVATSMAICKAGAMSLGIPLYEYIGRLAGIGKNVLPVPQMNVINGGAHAGIENDIQEHMIIPIGKNFRESLRMGCEIYQNLKAILKKRFGALATLVGDEGGFVPPLENVFERLEVITKAIRNAGYEGGCFLALDSAASEFYKNGVYTIIDKKFSSGEMIDFYKELISKFEIISIEDGLAEDDWNGWVELTKTLGRKIQIVGDDLLCTNPERIKKAIRLNAINSILIKPNQIGTVTETIEACKLRFEKGYGAVVSHRSGSSEEIFVSDLVVGLSTGQSKFGAPARSDRNCKYNELLRIEEVLGNKAKFPGKDFRKV